MASLRLLNPPFESLAEMFPISCPTGEDRLKLWDRIKGGNTGIYEIDNGKGFIALSVFPSSLYVELVEGKNLSVRSLYRVLVKMCKACKVKALTGDIDSWRFERVYRRMGATPLSTIEHNGKIVKRMVSVVNG